MKHTPGPWEIGSPHHDNPNGERYNANCITSEAGCGVCQVYGIPMQTTLKEAESLTDPRYIEGLANARLIASAPELLAALRVIAEIGGNLTDDRLTDKTGANDAVQRGLMYCHAREAARAAIRKAEPPC